MDLVWILLLVAVLIVLWLGNLFGVPGNWLIVGAVAGCAYWGGQVPADHTAAAIAAPWWLVGVLVVLALVGEGLELLAGAMGAKRVGGSKRGALLALVGSLAGGVVGLFVGIPIPVVGSILAALVFAGAGALFGAMVGELWKGKDLSGSWEIGKAAFWGRILGTLAKALVGGVMITVTAVALIVPWVAEWFR